MFVGQKGCIEAPLEEPSSLQFDQKELRLSDFPEAFKESVLTLVGDNASEIELEVAKEVSSLIQKKTGNEPFRKKASEATSGDRKNYNLIIVGTPNTNPILNEIYKISDASQVNETFPGARKGVVEILVNPWNEGKAMLLVEGWEEWGVKAGSEILKEKESSELNVRMIVTEHLTNGLVETTDGLVRKAAKDFFIEQYGEGINRNAIIVEESKSVWTNKLFPDCVLYKATLVLSRNIEICPSVPILVGEDKSVFVLPVNLTEALQKEGIDLEQKDLILDIVKVYCETELLLVSGKDLIFLNEASDIPWITRPESAKAPSEFDKIITAPELYFGGETWHAELYTYERIGGIVKKWEFEIGQDYQIEVKSIEIAKKIGDFADPRIL